MDEKKGKSSGSKSKDSVKSVIAKRESKRSKDIDEAFPWTEFHEKCVDMLDHFSGLSECNMFRTAEFSQFANYSHYVSDPITLDIVKARLTGNDEAKGKKDDSVKVKKKKISKVSSFVHKVRQVFVNALRYWLDHPDIREPCYLLLGKFNERLAENFPNIMDILQKDRLHDGLKDCRDLVDKIAKNSNAPQFHFLLFPYNHPNLEGNFDDFPTLVPNATQPYVCFLEIISRLNYEQYLNLDEFYNDMMKCLSDWEIYFTSKGKVQQSQKALKHINKSRKSVESFFKKVKGSKPVPPPTTEPKPTQLSKSSLSVSIGGSKAVQDALNKLLGKVAKADRHNDFQVPVDWKAYNLMDYPDIVKTPMDFSTIRSKLNSGIYETVGDFVQDCDLVFSNCELYNQNPSSHILTACSALKAKLRKFELDLLEPVLHAEKEAAATAATRTKPSVSIASSEASLPLPSIKQSKASSVVPPLDCATILAETADAADQNSSKHGTKEKKKKKKKKSTLVYAPTFPEAAACAQVLQDIRKMKEAGPFLEPVDWAKTGLTDYPLIITNPMDFRTMQQKLEKGYTSLAEFKADAALVFSNCRTYNLSEVEDFPVLTFCTAVEEKFKTKLSQRLEELKGTATETAVDNTTDMASSNGTKSPSGHSTFPKSDCKKILDEVKSLQAARSFLKDHSDLKGYTDLIKHPMNLKTISNKLKTYKTAEEFAADMRLVFNNALLFHKEDDSTYPVRKYATELLETFEGLYREKILDAPKKEKKPSKTASSLTPTSPVKSEKVKDKESSKKSKNKSKNKDKERKKEKVKSKEEASSKEESSSKKKDKQREKVKVESSGEMEEEELLPKIKLDLGKTKEKEKRPREKDNTIATIPKKKIKLKSSQKQQKEDIINNLQNIMASASSPAPVKEESIKSSSSPSKSQAAPPPPPPPPPPPASPACEIPPPPIFRPGNEYKRSGDESFSVSKQMKKKSLSAPISRGTGASFDPPNPPARDLLPFEQSCSKAVIKLGKTEWGGQFFGKPVVETFHELRESYLAVISKPVDLRTVLENIYCGDVYDTDEAINSDVLLMFKNANVYNSDDSINTKQMRAKFHHLELLWNHFYAERPDADPELRKKRRAEREEMLGPEELSIMLAFVNKVLKKLKQPKLLDCHFFLDPVDTKLFSDYTQIVEKPMDLSTISKNISNGEYNVTGGVAAFAADMRRIFENCLRYNGDIPANAVIREAAVNMRERFEVEWATVTCDALEKRNRSQLIKDQSVELEVEKKLQDGNIARTEEARQQLTEEITRERANSKKRKRTGTAGADSKESFDGEDDMSDDYAMEEDSDDDEFSPADFGKSSSRSRSRGGDSGFNAREKGYSSSSREPIFAAFHRKQVVESRRTEESAAKEYQVFLRKVKDIKELAASRAKEILRQEKKQAKLNATTAMSPAIIDEASSPDAMSEEKMKEVLATKIVIHPKMKGKRKRNNLTNSISSQFDADTSDVGGAEKNEAKDTSNLLQSEGGTDMQRENDVIDMQIEETAPVHPSLLEWQSKVLAVSAANKEAPFNHGQQIANSMNSTRIVKLEVSCEVPRSVVRENHRLVTVNSTPSPLPETPGKGGPGGGPKKNKGKQIVSLLQKVVAQTLNCRVSQRILDLGKVKLCFGMVLVTVSTNDEDLRIQRRLELEVDTKNTSTAMEVDQYNSSSRSQSNAKIDQSPCASSGSLEGVSLQYHTPIPSSAKELPTVPAPVTFVSTVSTSDAELFKSGLNQILHLPSAEDRVADLSLLGPKMMMARRFIEKIPEQDFGNELDILNEAKVEQSLSSWRLAHDECLLFCAPEIQERGSRPFIAVRYIGLAGKLSINVGERQILSA